MEEDQPEAVIDCRPDRQVGELGNPPGEEPTVIHRWREARPLVQKRLAERGAARLFEVDGGSPVREPERAAEDPGIGQMPSDQRRVVAERAGAREHVRLGAPWRRLAVLERELE